MHPIKHCYIVEDWHKCCLVEKYRNALKAVQVIHWKRMEAHLTRSKNLTFMDFRFNVKNAMAGRWLVWCCGSLPGITPTTPRKMLLRVELRRISQVLSRHRLRHIFSKHYRDWRLGCTGLHRYTGSHRATQGDNDVKAAIKTWPCNPHIQRKCAKTIQVIVEDSRKKVLSVQNTKQHTSPSGSWLSPVGKVWVGVYTWNSTCSNCFAYHSLKYDRNWSVHQQPDILDCISNHFSGKAPTNYWMFWQGMT